MKVGGRRRWVTPFLLGKGAGGLGLLLALAPVQAAPLHRPHVVLILCDAITFSDVHNRAYPHLARFTETGALGLMNCAVAGPKTPTAATLTLAIGQHLPAEVTDEQAANDGESVPGEQGTAAEVYARRVGQPASTDRDRSSMRVKHLGIAGLARRGLDTDRLGAALAQETPKIQTFVVGNADTETWGRRAAALTVDALGVGAGVVAAAQGTASSLLRDDPTALARAISQAHADFTVVQLGDTARIEAARAQFAPEVYRSARAEALRRLDELIVLLSEKSTADGDPVDILLVSPYPPVEQAHYPGVWGRLTPVVASGPDFPPGLLTSATTRTPGLLANVDIAPTILALFAAQAPVTMIGRPLQVIVSETEPSRRMAAVARLDQMAALNGRATIPLMASIGSLCFLLVLAGLIAWNRGGAQAARRFAPGLLFTQNLPTALLLAPLGTPPTILRYGLEIVAWMAGLTVASSLLARLVRISPPVAAAFLGIALVVGDTLAGQPLLKDSLLSSYPLSGIRYYGVGNEYLGVLLGFALAGGFAWLEDRRVPYPSAVSGHVYRWALALGWLGLLLLLGWPGLGANAGSLAATSAGFGLGTAILAGKRPTVRLGIACTLAGLLLAFVFGVVDAALAAHASSHLGAAVQAASGGRGPGYLAEIALRKLAMNLRLLVSPWLLLPAGAVVVTLLAARALVGDSWRFALQRRPWTARGLTATLAATLASLLFKDSGVVTATFLIGSECVILLSLLLTDDPDPPAAVSADSP